MTYQFSDPAQNITMQTNETGELIIRMCDGTNAFSDIIARLMETAVNSEELLMADPSSTELVNDLMAAFDIPPETSCYIMKIWRLGGVAFIFNNKTDALNAVPSELAHAILQEAQVAPLDFNQMKSLMADEMSFEIISAKRRGQEPKTNHICSQMFSDLRYLLEKDLLIPQVVA